jgi:dTDP-4-amino-4,6-dideoxygalactose transaminase
LAAIGVAQMEEFPSLLQNKRTMDQFYRSQLSGIGDIEFQEVSPDVRANCWLFTFKTKQMRNLLAHLNENGVQSRPFWMPMYQLEMFKNDIFVSHENQSEKVYQSAISIPSSAGITRAEMETVVNTIKAFYQSIE